VSTQEEEEEEEESESRSGLLERPPSAPDFRFKPRNNLLAPFPMARPHAMEASLGRQRPSRPPFN